MRLRHLCALLLLAFPIACFSQVELKDSISFKLSSSDSVRVEAAGMSYGTTEIFSTGEYNRVYNPVGGAFTPYGLAYPYSLHIHYSHFNPGRASLFNWNGGEVVATGGSRTFPGLMQIDNGALGIYQSVGNFTFHAGGMVNKYGYFNGVHTQYGLNGSIKYQFSPYLSATVFGDYYYGQPPRMGNGMPLPASIIGYYGQSRYGGYIDCQINEHWGVQAGVQTVQQVGTNNYKAEPIVTPYYKISKKVAIGLPVGQIMYHILKR